jgi:hypothetical protein
MNSSRLGNFRAFLIALPAVAALTAILAGPSFAADANKLYGIHWWGHSEGYPVDTAPQALLDVPAYSAWDTETILTNSDYHWSAPFFTGLYSTLYAWNVSLITRVDYTWTDCVPAPADGNYSGWPSSVVNNVVNPLKNQTHIWIVGNEPNILTGGGSFWPNNRIQPADYADAYRRVKDAIHASPAGAAGSHMVLLAGPSFGPAEGVRWMAGADYLAQTLSYLAPSEIDGFAIHAYGWDVTGFRNDYQSQIRILDQKGFGNKPIWITEFNRYTTDGNDEQYTAQFARDAFADVNTHNQTVGSRDIVGLTWFVYDSNQQAGGGWNNYAIEYWKDNGFPSGDSRDLWTAFAQTVDLRYPAGEWNGGTEVIVDNPSCTLVGSWYTGTIATDKYGSNYFYATTAATETKSATWRPSIPTNGEYDVYAWYSQGSNRSAAAPYLVSWNGGSQAVNVNQTTNGGKWNLLASRKQFAAGTTGTVKLGNGTGETSKVVIADATRFDYFGPTDIILDNPLATYSGTWSTGTASTDKYGADYRFALTAATETAWAKWTPTIVSGTNYNVYIWYPQGGNRSIKAPYTVYYNGGSQLFQVNQTANGGKWNLLTNKNFAVGTSGYVKLGNGTAETSKVVMADAVKWSTQ